MLVHSTYCKSVWSCVVIGQEPHYHHSQIYSDLVHWAKESFYQQFQVGNNKSSASHLHIFSSLARGSKKIREKVVYHMFLDEVIPYCILYKRFRYFSLADSSVESVGILGTFASAEESIWMFTSLLVTDH